MSDDDITALAARVASIETQQQAFASAELLLQVAIDPKACSARVAELKRTQARVLKVVNGRLHALEKREAAFAEYEQQTRAELAKLQAKTQSVYDEVKAREGAIEAREERVFALEQEWRFAGEPAEVRSGFREPLYGSALEKARRHYGLDAELPSDGEDKTKIDPGFVLTPTDGATLTRG